MYYMMFIRCLFATQAEHEYKYYMNTFVFKCCYLRVCTTYIGNRFYKTLLNFPNAKAIYMTYYLYMIYIYNDVTHNNRPT